MVMYKRCKEITNLIYIYELVKALRQLKPSKTVKCFIVMTLNALYVF